jgi:glycerol kinase
VAPIVSWQDLRAVNTAPKLAEQGFAIARQMAAAKDESVIEAVENGRARMHAGELAWENVDTFVISKLSGGTAHAIDLSHLSATGI